MKVYNYHPETKEYIGESDARPNPLEPGNFLIPALATTKVPPGAIPGKARVFDGVWTQVEDHRGNTIWNKDGSYQAVKVIALGVIPASYTEITCPNNESKWNGVAWVVDQVKVDERLAREAKKVKAEMARNALKATQMSSINNVPGLRDAVIKILDALEIEYIP